MKKDYVKKRVLCISIAKRPGTFGSIVHNTGYKALGLNWIYIPFKVTNLQDTIKGIRALGIRGCSVSMPFKETVIPFLDKLDPIAKKAKAVNTIVNNDGYLTGYNTDVLGIQKCLSLFKIKNNQKIIVLGSGGVARAVLTALQNLNLKNIILTNRTSQRGKDLAREFKIDFTLWTKRQNIFADIIINTTSIGMHPNTNVLPISESQILNSQIVMDVIVSSKNTKLIQIAKKYKKITIEGTDLALNQAYEQFKVYTGRNPPKHIMKKTVQEIFNSGKK